jgi:hypothetical protein
MALGDIVLCLVGKRLLAHRVVKRTALGLTIRGDSHRSGEDCIGFDQVLGRVMHVERSSFGRRCWSRWMAAKAKISRLWTALHGVA